MLHEAYNFASSIISAGLKYSSMHKKLIIVWHLEAKIDATKEKFIFHPTPSLCL